MDQRPAPSLRLPRSVWSSCEYVRWVTLRPKSFKGLAGFLDEQGWGRDCPELVVQRGRGSSDGHSGLVNVPQAHLALGPAVCSLRFRGAAWTFTDAVSGHN